VGDYVSSAYTIRKLLPLIRRTAATQNHRGIEWSLRALVSMRAERLFLQARAVIKYVLRAASTLKNTDGEQRALRKFSRLNL